VALDSPSKEVKDLVGEEDGITAAVSGHRVIDAG
jgi:hypothetical protein